MSTEIVSGFVAPAGVAAIPLSQVQGPTLTAIGDYAAFLARLTTPLTIAQDMKARVAWKLLHTDSLWSKIDVFAGGLGSMADSLLNWKGASFTATLPAAPAAPTWDATNGFVFDGVDDWIDTGFNPTTAAGQYALNSAHIAALVTDTGANATAYAVGTIQAGGDYTRLLARSGTVTGRINSGTTFPTVTAADGRGSWVINRTTSLITRLLRNNALITELTNNTATNLPTTSVSIGRDNTTYFAGEVKAWAIGGALTTREQAALSAALNALA